MLIFLDIDGVMVPAKAWKRPEILGDGFPAFSEKAVKALRNLLSGEVTVVLTTSHKLQHTIDEWKSIFKRRNLDIELVKILNDKPDHLSRREEIIDWFNSNVVNENFIIIDDDKSLNSLPNYLKQKLILTNPMVGLTEEHLAIANSILDKGFELA